MLYSELRLEVVLILYSELRLETAPMLYSELRLEMAPSDEDRHSSTDGEATELQWVGSLEQN